MLVMPSNNHKANVHYWAGKGYSIGWLLSPRDDAPRPVCEWLPYSIDNGRFAVWQKKTEWAEHSFITYLEFYAEQSLKPNWVVVPDCVGDKDKTLQEWEKWQPVLVDYGIPLAFCVQDGMMPQDVPNNADVVFVGGTFAWKWSNLHFFTQSFENVHVGRVNTFRHLQTCKELGATSCDGTGWFRHSNRWQTLEKWFKIQSGELQPDQLEFAL